MLYKKTLKIEFALLFSDNTWQTKIFNIPISFDNSTDSEIEFWLENKLSKNKNYKQLVGVKVYNINPQI